MDAATPSRVVIVGAGHGGANAAALLRQQGYAGQVVLLSAEESLPYQRPPLSKDFLKAELAASELLIKPEAFWAEQAIDLRLGTPAAAIDTVAKHVDLSNGESLSYDALFLSTGAVARKLDVPGAGLADVCELRTRADADRLDRKSVV